MTFGSLFAGIGGFDLGFERAGLRCEWQVELDPFCRKVLAKHWPDVRRHDDVRTFPPTDADEWRVDVICGGFPCQDISNAGKRAGIDGERSGLWSEYARVVRVVRPRYVVVENVSALLARGLCRVLGDLAACGYDAEWDCIPAAAVGAPHRRDRLFVVAYPPELFRNGCGVYPRGDSEGWTTVSKLGNRCPAEALADASGVGLERAVQPGDGGPACFGEFARRSLAGAGEQGRGEQWGAEPAVGRVADGVPNRVDRLRGLGNAVVPQVAEFIGRRLMAAHAEEST